jgi:hypothetical protein
MRREQHDISRHIYGNAATVRFLADSNQYQAHFLSPRSYAMEDVSEMQV